MVLIIKSWCCSDQQATSVISTSSTTRRTNARTSGAGKCERQVRCCESTTKVRDALKEEPRNSMVDSVLQMAKVVIVKSATNGSELRDG